METFNISTPKCSNIFYRKAGKGHPVVLLHGFPENGGLWSKVMPGLAETFTVIVPDLPGAGESSLPTGTTTMEALAEAVAAVLQHEAIEHAVVAGHSMGGYTALAFAEKYPEQLKGLSLIHSAATPDTEEKKQTRRKSIELIRKGGKEPFVKGMTPNLFAERFNEQHGDVIAQQIERGMQLSGDSMIAFYNAMINRPDRVSILSEATFPVQWIMGKEDSVVPLQSALRQSCLANIDFVSLYNEVGHMSMLEQPEKLLCDLREFIAYCYNH
jgi:pimeloyl-ACP methyl ester carboxylesterase